MATNNATNTVPLIQDGDLLIGVAGANPQANRLTAGGGINILNAPGNITISSAGGGFSTIVANAANINLAPSTQYITDFGALVTYTLPAVAAVGDTYRIIGKSFSGWTIAQNAAQTINVGSINSTAGVAGSVSSTALFDCITVVCVTANTEFACYGTQGIFNVI